MNKTLGIIVQLILTVGQMFNLVSGFLPEDAKWIVAIAIGALQVVAQGVQAHYNPDGTPAKVPYTK